MAKLDPQILAHLEWLGFVRPTGLVVSAPALVRAGAILNQRDADGQRLLRSAVANANGEPRITDFHAFAATVLGWSFSPKGYAGTSDTPIPVELELALPDAGETLKPDYAVRELEPQNGASGWQLLIRVLDAEQGFDAEMRGTGRLGLSPQSRMERLLRHTGVPAGLLVNAHGLRLVSAPRGESSGWIDFRVADMVETAGRPIVAALRLLLSEQRLLALPRAQRLSALLADSRKFQNEVSEKLAEQVLHALYELLRGFQAAQDASKGELLRDVLTKHPDQVYRGLLTVILRLVFLLYAEERDVLPGSATFLRYYSLAGLHNRLREDVALYPDTMDQRFGAWAQLVSLFRMIHDGADGAGMHLPARHGVLFDPDRYPFLEGRTDTSARQIHQRLDPPLVPDGTIYRALDKLLVLDGERISYRALDVEQIGSVYEEMMGFRLETAAGRSVAIKAQKKHGAPTAVDLDAVLALAGSKRGEWLEKNTDRKLTDRVKQAVAAATTLPDLHAALLTVVDQAATPDLVPKGAMVLQPSEERRRSGSHYTPRELTEPIVRTTLDPILARLRGKNGEPPKPAAILDLKVCDPAMGSGAFLVEACRYLGDALLEAWRVHGGRPAIPADEDEVVVARGLVAQRCLYGVDRNPVAVDLAKMSLWLVTLAKDHALTFLDHALRHGDSLVGLSRRQLEAFHWKVDAPAFQAGFEAMRAREHLLKVSALRQQIRDAGDGVSDQELRRLWNDAEFELGKVRLLGDLVIAAYFAGKNTREREAKRLEFANAVVRGDTEQYRGWLDGLRDATPPLAPFHWQIEFPEVFERKNPGFDAFVGNPPFLGGTRISEVDGMTYFQWLVSQYPPCEHHCDLVAYFFRRIFYLLRTHACFGLLATNTISQGDTREGGLTVLLNSGGQVFSATRRLKWPGDAAVIVSVIHISKLMNVSPVLLDGCVTSRISSYLVPGAHDTSPARLKVNPYFSLGSKIYGQGFLFSYDDPKCTPINERTRLANLHPSWAERMPPYLVGEEINASPKQEPNRYVINMSDIATEEELSQWPELRAIIETKVKPERMKLGSNPNNTPLKKKWWAYQAHRPALYAALTHRRRALCISRVGHFFAFAFEPTVIVFSEAVVVFDIDASGGFCVLQCRVHELWARFFSSSLKDDLRYTPSDCFETFPFPVRWETDPTLEAVGESYYDFRATLMVRNNDGLTKTYNRFHDPDERDPDILKLRELHAAMDRAVLDAYGWQDLQPTCDFYLDYEIDEETWGNKKKPWRYRWSDDMQAEVLARLLELNAKRAKEEALAGITAGGKKARKTGKRKVAVQHDKGDLFG